MVPKYFRNAIGMQSQYDLWQASRHRRKKATPFFVGAGGTTPR
jgi:hypothetical protein